MSDWRDSFKSYVFRTNFQLHLTRPMLELLCAVADDVMWDRGVLGIGSSRAAPDNMFATEDSLIKRGLIERKRQKRDHGWRSVFEIKAFCELTPAGRALVELLKVTGVFIEADNAIQRRAAKVRP